MISIIKPREKKIIVLTGIMGSGKTTIGSRLADKLKIYFIDSDKEIEDLEKMSIAKIFDLKGESYFRKTEIQIIKEIINRDEPMVLSLGGGAFIDREVRDLVKQKAISVWLYADIETIIHRTSNKSSRPLLRGQDSRVIISNLIKQRYPIYKESDIHVSTSGDNYESIIQKIIREIDLFIISN